MTKDEALMLALEALETCEWVDDGGNGHAEYNHGKVVAALLAIKEVLAQPEQELVVWGYARKIKGGGWVLCHKRNYEEAIAYGDNAAVLYTTQAQSEQDEKFCDSNCVWTDQHPNCKLAQPEQELIGLIDIGRIFTPEKEAVEEPKQKPVVVSHSIQIECQKCGATEHGSLSFTQSPPQRTWQGLTDEEIDKTHETQVWDARRSYARAIETKLKEKNT